MSKTLSNILIVFKVARIVAKVIFILCLIGGIGSLIGLVCLPMASGLLALDIVAAEGIDIASAYLGCLISVIVCSGEAVMAFLAERYFKNVLRAGTPFTFDGAKEVFRLGVASIIVSVAVSVLTGILTAIVLLFAYPTVIESDFNVSISLSTGLFFMFLSMLFKHGAELNGTKTDSQTTDSENV